MECPKCVSKATPDPSCSVCRGSGEASWTKPAVQRERYPGELRSAAVKPRETVQQAQARERGEARARATDPGTSHAAADSITAGRAAGAPGPRAGAARRVRSLPRRRARPALQGRPRGAGMAGRVGERDQDAPERARRGGEGRGHGGDDRPPLRPALDRLEAEVTRRGTIRGAAAGPPSGRPRRASRPRPPRGARRPLQDVAAYLLGLAIGAALVAAVCAPFGTLPWPL